MFGLLPPSGSGGGSGPLPPSGLCAGSGEGDERRRLGRARVAAPAAQLNPSRRVHRGLFATVLRAASCCSGCALLVLTPTSSLGQNLSLSLRFFSECIGVLPPEHSLQVEHREGMLFSGMLRVAQHAAAYLAKPSCCLSRKAPKFGS